MDTPRDSVLGGESSCSKQVLLVPCTASGRATKRSTSRGTRGAEGWSVKWKVGLWVAMSFCWGTCGQ